MGRLVSIKRECVYLRGLQGERLQSLSGNGEEVGRKASGRISSGILGLKGG